jgi:hypothetical protein
MDMAFGASGIVDFKSTSLQRSVLGLSDGSAIITTGQYAFRLLGRPDPSPGIIGIVSTPSIPASIATLRVQRVAGSDGAVRVRYWMPAVADLPPGPVYATPGVDYDSVSGELEWSDGDDWDKLIEIPLHLRSAVAQHRRMVVSFEVVAGESGLVPASLEFGANFGPQAPASSGGGGQGGGGGAFGWPALILLLAAVRRRMRGNDHSLHGIATVRNAA